MQHTCKGVTWYGWHIVGTRVLAAVVLAFVALSCGLVLTGIDCEFGSCELSHGNQSRAHLIRL